MTLVVPGGLISGHVENASDHYNELSRYLQDGVARFGDEQKNETAKTFAEFFFEEPAQVMADQVLADEQAFKDGKLREPRHFMTRYLHLKQAYYTAPGQTSVSLDRTRVLLSQVVADRLLLTY